MVPEGDRRCPDSHDLSECHHLYALGRHIEQPKGHLGYALTLRPLLAAKNLLPPISLTVLTLIPKIFLQQPSGTTLRNLLGGQGSKACLYGNKLH